MGKKRREEPPQEDHSQFCGVNVEKLAFAVGIAGVIAGSSMFALWLFTDNMGAIISVVLLLSHSSLLIGLKTRKLFFYSIYLMIQALLICACLVVVAIYVHTLITGRPPDIVADRYKSWQVDKVVANISMSANDTDITAHSPLASDLTKVETDEPLVVIDLAIFVAVLTVAFWCYHVASRAKKHAKDVLKAELKANKKKQLAWKILKGTIGWG